MCSTEKQEGDVWLLSQQSIINGMFLHFVDLTQFFSTLFQFPDKNAVMRFFKAALTSDTAVMLLCKVSQREKQKTVTAYFSGKQLLSFVLCIMYVFIKNIREQQVESFSKILKIIAHHYKTPAIKFTLE